MDIFSLLFLLLPFCMCSPLTSHNSWVWSAFSGSCWHFLHRNGDFVSPCLPTLRFSSLKGIKIGFFKLLNPYMWLLLVQTARNAAVVSRDQWQKFDWSSWANDFLTASSLRRERVTWFFKIFFNIFEMRVNVTIIGNRCRLNSKHVDWFGYSLRAFKGHKISIYRSQS